MFDVVCSEKEVDVRVKGKMKVDGMKPEMHL